MKDTFNSGAVEAGLWTRIQGGSVTESCAQIVTGMSLFFNGPGLRQAVTADLDLRNARSELKPENRQNFMKSGTQG